MHVWPSELGCISRRFKPGDIYELTRADRSTCPGAAAGLTALPGPLAPLLTGGRGAEGTGGFPPAALTGATGGLAPTAGGLGLFAIEGGGGLDAKALEGLDPDGELSELAAATFFQGVADPFAAAIPGNTDTGFAFAFAVTGAAGGAGAAFGGGAFLGGGGGAAGADGGTSSK